MRSDGRGKKSNVIVDRIERFFESKRRGKVNALAVSANVFISNQKGNCSQKVCDP